MKGATRVKAMAGYIWVRLVRRVSRNNLHMAWSDSDLPALLDRINLDPASGQGSSGSQRFVRLGQSRFEALEYAARDEPLLGEMLDCLRRYNAEEYPHATGSFESHLLGTWHILACWRQPTAVTRCGLFHSAYATDVYPRALISPDSRDKLRALIGESAEALVFFFCTLNRRELISDLIRFGTIPSDGMQVSNWTTGEHLIAPARLLGAYVTIELANLAEQSRGIGGGPGGWMAMGSKLAALLPGNAERVPSIFNACRNGITRSDELRARRLYVAARRGKIRPDVLTGAVEANPWVAEPLLDLAIHEGDRVRAREAEKLLLQWGTSWDKRRKWSEMLATARGL